jgi:protein TonB
MKTPIYADLDQIVFEGRSQDYGAYEMRKKYNRILSRAMLIAFLMFISLTALPKIIDWVRPAVPEVVEVDERVIITDYKGTDLPKDKVEEIEEIELPVERGGPLDAATVRFATPVPVPDDVSRDEETIAAVADFDSAAVALEDHDGLAVAGYNWSEIGEGDPFEGGDLELGGGEGEGEGEGEDDPWGFSYNEKEPMPVNMSEVAALIGYPAMAKEANIEGKVTLRVKVDKNGKYAKHIVVKDPHPILTKAVTDKISNLVFTPGIQSGKPVAVWVTIPFNFELKK